ncbi:MAG: TVP38/TMEM64 family protein [Clostridia bacterium]|nr:TVP38/TMEM64 family protein [Clostridia bacterium]
MKSIKAKKIISLLALALILAGTIWLYFAQIKPAYERMGGVEGLRDWLQSHSWGGRIAFVAMVVAQILIAFIPGEPLELAAGYAFGAVEGTILCMLGILIGSLLVFALVRTLGMRFVNLFFSADKIRELPFWKNQRRLELIAFILFLIPGTPKDLMTYAMGLTPIRLSRWILISGIARIPSVITSTACADALALGQYHVAALLLAGTGLLALLGLWLYRREQKKQQQP